jgi:hypothetical protein
MESIQELIDRAVEIERELLGYSPLIGEEEKGEQDGDQV